MKVRELKERLKKWEVDDEDEILVASGNALLPLLPTYFYSETRGCYIFVMNPDERKPNA